MRKRRFSKPLQVADKADRTRRGVEYDSKAEADRADELDLLLRTGNIIEVREQVTFQLGPDTTYRADFVITDAKGVCAEDVKGYPSRDFQRTIRLWKKYGTMPLRIMTRVGKKWSIEWIYPERNSDNGI